MNMVMYIIINTNTKEKDFKKYNRIIIKDKIRGHLGPLAHRAGFQLFYDFSGKELKLKCS